MVVPSLPRFLRLGDKVSIHSQVINQSKDNLNGKARLELFDPTTDTLLKGYPMSQSFTLDADSTIALSWDIDVPDCNGLVGCRIIAERTKAVMAKSTPILSNQLLITESTPFFFAEPGENRSAGTIARAERLSVWHWRWLPIRSGTLSKTSDSCRAFLRWRRFLAQCVFFSNTLSAHHRTIESSNQEDLWCLDGSRRHRFYTLFQSAEERWTETNSPAKRHLGWWKHRTKQNRNSVSLPLRPESRSQSEKFLFPTSERPSGGRRWIPAGSRDFHQSDYITLYAVDLFTHLVHLGMQWSWMMKRRRW